MTGEQDAIPEDIAALGFEEALAALEEIVGKLESGSVNLEDSIDMYTRGTWLKRHCEAKLRLAEARIEKIALREDGEVSSEDFEDR